MKPEDSIARREHARSCTVRTFNTCDTTVQKTLEFDWSSHPLPSGSLNEANEA